MSEVRQGLADGTKTAYDVDRLVKDGAIGRATGAWLKQLADEARQERAEAAAGRDRVESVLRDGGKLDPKKAGDRAANDAYFTEVVAPSAPDQATLVALLGKLGLMPTPLGQRIRGGLASDQPQEVVSVASLLIALGKQDGTLTKGFGRQRASFARAVMDGVDGKLSPERAVALAAKRHGQPDVSDDDDATQIAEAEGHGESDAGNGGGGETKGTGASDTKEDKTKADASAAETPGETVGPEIVPVGDTEDGDRDASGESGILSKVGSDIVGGVEETPEQAKGGLLDTVRETLETLDSLFRWKWNNRALLGKLLGLLDDDAPEQPGGETPFQSAADAIPEAPPATTVTGGIVRGIAQFLSSYFIGSKGFGAGLKALGAGERAARLGKPLAGSVFADAIARDPAEQNLANLIEDHAELKIPVLEYLVASDDDSEAEARFKKALEGLLLGPLSDAAMRPLIEGLGLAVKAIKARRRVLRESGVPDEEFRQAEREQLARAYDEVRAQPHGPIDDPIVRIRPEGLDEILVERGPAFERDGKIIVRGRQLQRLFGTKEGFGLVKIIWRHGEHSGKEARLQVQRDDVTALPDVVRDFEPSRVDGWPGADRYGREYRVERDGRIVVYVIVRFTKTDGKDHVVSIHVEGSGGPGSERTLSRRRNSN